MLRETTAVKINLPGAFIILMSPDRDVEEKIRNTWDEMACGYSRFISDEFSYVKMVEMPAIMELLGDVNGKLVLDLGCGSGEYSLALAVRARSYRAGHLGKVPGAGAREGGKGECRHRAGTMLHFESRFLKGRQFDMVFSSTTMHYVKDIDGVFQAGQQAVEK